MAFVALGESKRSPATSDKLYAVIPGRFCDTSKDVDPLLLDQKTLLGIDNSANGLPNCQSAVWRNVAFILASLHADPGPSTSFCT